MKPPLLIAADFDGTVTKDDTLVEILDKYGSPHWRKIQDKVVSGELSIREGLQQEMGSVRATHEEIADILKNQVKLDPGFAEFYQEMRSLGIPVVLVSGGFDLCVETVMAKQGLWPIPYLANRLSRVNGTWTVEYPYPSETCQACGHCKGDPIREWNAKGYTTVFVGNGVTDRCAAMSASLTFAKDELETWCKKQKIAAASFQTFHDIRADLKQRGWI